MTLELNSDGFFEVLPKPSEVDLAEYYRDKYFSKGKWQNCYSREYTAEELEHKKLVAEEINFYAGSTPGSYFEVGVGEGFVMKEFERLGWRVSGVDYTSEGIEAHFPELQPFVEVGDLCDRLQREVAAGAKHDLVVCNGVLEHVREPETVARLLRDIVHPHGLCRIWVPNDGSWLQREVVKRGHADDNYWVCPPDHLSYFTHDSLQRFLKRCGWRVLDVLGGFPMEIFLLNSDSCYTRDRRLGRNCHFARVAFEMGLWRQSIDHVIAFRRGCARAGIGRDTAVYVRPA